MIHFALVMLKIISKTLNENIVGAIYELPLRCRLFFLRPISLFIMMPVAGFCF